MDSVYIRGVQNIGFGQAFSNENDCILQFKMLRIVFIIIKLNFSKYHKTKFYIKICSDVVV